MDSMKLSQAIAAAICLAEGEGQLLGEFIGSTPGEACHDFDMALEGTMLNETDASVQQGAKTTHREPHAQSDARPEDAALQEFMARYGSVHNCLLGGTGLEPVTSTV